MSSAGRDALVAMLSRLKNDLHGLNLNRPEASTSLLHAKYPLGGDYLVEVRRLCERGLEAGWLVVNDVQTPRLASLAKPAKHFPYSIDASHLSGDGLGHVHPKGEVNLCWGVSGKPKFCGAEPGWVVYPPGSRHVPSVVGGTMLVLNFLPDGEIAWEKSPAKDLKAKILARGSTSVAVARPAARKRAAARG